MIGPMKIVVFGASGRLGSRVVDEALRREHEVTGVARDAMRVDGREGRIERFAGDATEPGSVASIAADHDVAISAVTQHERPEMLVELARGLLEGLALAGVPRLVVAGGAGSLKVPSGERLLDTPDFHEEWKPEAIAQARALEVYEQAETDVDWSYISPAALLEPGERTGGYRTGDDQLLVDEQGRSRITMEDFAIAMLDEAEEQRHPRARFTVAH
jgi:putative NADH-flavin reductase